MSFGLADRQDRGKIAVSVLLAAGKPPRTPRSQKDSFHAMHHAWAAEVKSSPILGFLRAVLDLDLLDLAIEESVGNITDSTGDQGTLSRAAEYNGENSCLLVEGYRRRG
jgi:hypothetical protein